MQSVKQIQIRRGSYQWQFYTYFTEGASVGPLKFLHATVYFTFQDITLQLLYSAVLVISGKLVNKRFKNQSPPRLSTQYTEMCNLSSLMVDLRYVFNSFNIEEALNGITAAIF